MQRAASLIPLAADKSPTFCSVRHRRGRVPGRGEAKCPTTPLSLSDMNELEDTEWSQFQISGFLSVRRRTASVYACIHAHVRVLCLFTPQYVGKGGRPGCFAV